jgi:predicted small integral membrane protein
MPEKQVVAAPIEHKGRKGFLPFPTNAFDRVFISIYLFVALSLLWMRFIEPHGPSVWWAVAISVVLGVVIVRKG